MDTFFLAMIGVLLIAFVVYVIASARIERRAQSIEREKEGARQRARTP